MARADSARPGRSGRRRPVGRTRCSRRARGWRAARRSGRPLLDRLQQRRGREWARGRGVRARACSAGWGRSLRSPPSPGARPRRRGPGAGLRGPGRERGGLCGGRVGGAGPRRAPSRPRRRRCRDHPRAVCARQLAPCANAPRRELHCGRPRHVRGQRREAAEAAGRPAGERAPTHSLRQGPPRRGRHRSRRSGGCLRRPARGALRASLRAVASEFKRRATHLAPRSGLRPAAPRLGARLRALRGGGDAPGRHGARG
mmetsp:Transcript_13862/g.41928  ORF Transcript_13862/g.41928 Transcript_13862/m.41928 type:complete len:257 (+) Transcript_13862:458-1228(+)